MNTEIWNSSKMAGTGGALKALTKNLANQLTLNRTEMKRVVARVISERHGQGDVGDYNGHMFFVKPERVDLTEQITHSKEAFDDMIQQKHMMLCSSKNHMFGSPSVSRLRSVNMTLQSPKANKSLAGVIIDQKHLPKSGNPPEIVVQLSKPRIMGKHRSVCNSIKRIPVTLSPPLVHVRASKRRLSLRKPCLPVTRKSAFGGSTTKQKTSRKKMLIRSNLAKIKKPFIKVKPKLLSGQAQQLKQKLHQLSKHQQPKPQQESAHRLNAGTGAVAVAGAGTVAGAVAGAGAGAGADAGAGVGAGAGVKPELAVEKAQSLVEELVSSSVALSQKKSLSTEQSAVKKKKSLMTKKKINKLQSKDKIKLGNKQTKLDSSINSNISNSSNIKNNYSFGLKNAGKRLQAGGIMAEASKLGIHTPAVNRYTKYWRNPYQFPGGAGATQMYDTAKERYALASVRSKMLAKRKQVAAAIYTNFQREQQSHISLRRVKRKKSQAQILKQLKRNEAIDRPEQLDKNISMRCVKRRRPLYKLSARMEELAKPMIYRSASPEAQARGCSRSPVHRPKLMKQRLRRRRQRQSVVNNDSRTGSLGSLKRATSRSGLTPAKRHLTLAFLKNDGQSQRSNRHPRSSRAIHWR